MNRLTLARGIAAIDAHAWHVLCVLRLIADDAGVVHIERDEVAHMLNMTIQTLRKRLNALKAIQLVTFDEVGRIVVTPLAVGEETFVAHSIERRKDVSNDNTSTSEKAIIDYYRQRYAERYGVKPRIDYRMAGRTVAAFVRKHGDAERVKRIVDVVIDNYDQVWSNARFRTPAFGAVFGWIGDDASRWLNDEAKLTIDDERSSVKEWL